VRKYGERGAPPAIVPTPYELDRPSSSECPRSSVTQESEDLVQIVSTLLNMKDSAITMGAEGMPGSLLDAVKLAQREIRAQESAQDEAVNKA
jgi:hypothetical protein